MIRMTLARPPSGTFDNSSQGIFSWSLGNPTLHNPDFAQQQSRTSRRSVLSSLCWADPIFTPAIDMLGTSRPRHKTSRFARRR